MITKRDIAVAIILSIVTCGIYGIYWFIVLTDDAKKVSGNTDFPSGGLAFLLTLITCGIYGIYWAYKMGELVKTAQSNNGLQVKDNSILYLVLQLLGFGIIAYAMLQNDLNEIANLNKAA